MATYVIFFLTSENYAEAILKLLKWLGQAWKTTHPLDTPHLF